MTRQFLSSALSGVISLTSLLLYSRGERRRQLGPRTGRCLHCLFNDALSIKAKQLQIVRQLKNDVIWIYYEGNIGGLDKEGSKGRSKTDLGKPKKASIRICRNAVNIYDNHPSVTCYNIKTCIYYNTVKLVQGGTWIRRKLAQCEQFL
jgi:hypothetical protein